MYECNLHLFNCNGTQLKKYSDISYVMDLDDLERLINERYGLSNECYYVLHNGKKLCYSSVDKIDIKSPLHVIPRVLGGKGGFGSMLRAIGAQIEKTTNREACRDLSGRRLRDINEEQRLKNWIAQQADREKEAAERKKKKLERLCQEPKHDFKDDNYDETRSNITETMSTSIEQGMKASTSGNSSSKRKLENDVNKPSKKKKKNLWIDAEGSSSCSSSDCEDESVTEINTVVSSNN